MAQTIPELKLLEAAMDELRERLADGRDPTRTTMACDLLRQDAIQTVANHPKQDRRRLGKLQLAAMTTAFDTLKAATMPSPDEAGTYVLLLRQDEFGRPDVVGLFRTTASSEDGTLAAALEADANADPSDERTRDEIDAATAIGGLEPVAYMVVTITDGVDEEDMRSRAVASPGRHA